MYICENCHKGNLTIQNEPKWNTFPDASRELNLELYCNNCKKTELVKRTFYKLEDYLEFIKDYNN